MKKRLRKKNHVGEFQELGFDVDSALRPGMDRDAVHAFGDRFIAHIEAQQLAFGGGIGPTVGGFVTRFGRGSATEDDRASVRSFFASDPDIVQHVIGELRDASSHASGRRTPLLKPRPLAERAHPGRLTEQVPRCHAGSLDDEARGDPVTDSRCNEPHHEVISSS